MARVIKLTDAATKFGFKFDSKELEQAIGKASVVIASAPTNVKNFILLSAKGTVCLIAYNPDTFVYITLKSAKPEGDGAFAFTSADVAGIIKGRGEMQFKFSGTECFFNTVKGKYEGKIVTLPITTDQISLVNTTFEQKDKKEKKKEGAAEGSVLPRHVLDMLKEGVALTGIKDVYTGNALLAYMVLNEKGVLTVSSHDNHHFGHYKAKVKAGGITFKAALPSSHFLIIDKMVEEEDAKFFIRSQNMRVEGENFVLILPAHQADAKNFDLIGNFIKDLDTPDPKDKKGGQTFLCDYDHDKFTAMADNLFTLHSVNTSFEITHKKDSKLLSVELKTSKGSAKDSVAVTTSITNDVAAKVDPRMLRDILVLLRGQPNVTFGIFKDKVIRLGCKTKSGANVSLISALSG